MRKLLEAPLDPLERRVFRDSLDEITTLYRAARDEALFGVSRHFRGGLRVAVEEVERLLVLLRHSVEQRASVRAHHESLTQGLAAAHDEEQRRALMLEFLALFTPPERLAGDRKAFDRDMGLDCVEQRYHRWRTARWLREEILLRAIGRRVAEVARTLFTHEGESGADPVRRLQRLLSELRLERTLIEQAGGAARWRNQRAALRALGEIVRAVDGEYRARLFRRSTPFVVRCALDQRLSVWVQREALELVPLLVHAHEAERIVVRRLFDMDPHAGDDLFVRSKAVRVAADHIDTPRRRAQLLRRVLQRRDPSEHVRIEAAAALVDIDRVEVDRTLVAAVFGPPRQRDPSPRVRARCLEALCTRAERFVEREAVAAGALARAVTADTDTLVRRVAMEEAVRLARSRQRRLHKYKVDALDHTLLSALDTVIRSDPDIALKRFAARAREEIVLINDAAHAWFESRLAHELEALDEWSTLSVARERIAVPADVLGRLLALHARAGFGYMVQFRRRQVRFIKGDRFRTRLWRILHEIRHPDTAKRQAHRHTTGRVMYAEMRCPPELVAELVETKVPGERLWIGAEQSWRRFLPLLDDFLSMFSWLPWRRLRRVRIHSSEGMTEIIDRRPWWKAAWAHLHMSWHYARLARMRNAHPEDTSERERAAYLRVMRERYGFETLFYPACYRHEERRYPLEDPTIAEHFADAAFAHTLANAERSPQDGDTLCTRPLTRTASVRTTGDGADAPAADSDRAATRSDPTSDEKHGDANGVNSETDTPMQPDADAFGEALVDALLSPLLTAYERSRTAAFVEEDDAPHAHLDTESAALATNATDAGSSEGPATASDRWAPETLAALDETQPAEAIGRAVSAPAASTASADEARPGRIDDTADLAPGSDDSTAGATLADARIAGAADAAEQAAGAECASSDSTGADVLEDTAPDGAGAAAETAEETADQTAHDPIAATAATALADTADAAPAAGETTCDATPPAGGDAWREDSTSRGGAP